MRKPVPIRVALAWLLAASLNGCALMSAPDFERVAPPRSTHLADVPFFPQEKYQCGPAALATVLSYQGEPVTPQELVDEVYIPAREGTVQAEVVAAVRRRGLVPYITEGRAGVLGPALAAGYPLLVLLNLRSSLWPAWHYAVVVGTDNAGGDIILRSGETKQRQMNWWRFELAWRLADYWSVVVLGPDEIPDFAEPPTYLKAVAPWERQQPQWARQAYMLAAEQWPEQATPWVALGNLAVAHKQSETALDAYAEALSRNPDHPIALNNAADRLGHVGCPELGIQLLDRHLLAASPNSRWHEALSATRTELQGLADEMDCQHWRTRFAVPVD